jgi:hypothetical protein
VLLLSGSNRGATQTVNGATTFASDITLPVKNTAAAQNVTTHPASEHQVYLASQAGTTALNTHKTAATIDHPDLSVTTAKLAASAVTTAKITDKNVTVGKVQDITADDNSVKPTFSATAVTFQAFLQTVWQGITWLVYKMNASSGHKHTGGTDDAPQIGTSGIADSAVTSAKIADGTIVNADISATAAIATSKISGVSSSLTDGKFLKDTGTWVVPPDTVYTYPTTTGYKHIPSGGSSGQFLKWSSDGTATWAADNDTVYTHPAYTANASGLYKITVDSLGHVSATTAVSKADITGLGIPASDTNTTYAEMTGTTLGLVKLNGSYTFTGTINVPTPALPS